MISAAKYPLRKSKFETEVVSVYMKDIKHSVKLTTQEENTLALRIHAGDKHALKILVEANLKFVVAVCQNYRNQGLPLGDLINEGNLGLIRAALRFEGSKETRFISYAVWWIRQGILEALASQSRSMRIPASFTMGIHKINNATRTLFQKLGREPTVEELELETGMDANRIRDCRLLSQPTVSLNYSAEGEGGSEFQDSMADCSQPDVEMQMDIKQTRNVLAGLLSRLNLREREVLRLYFGIDSGVSNSLGEIANRYGLCRERVRQIKKRGLTNLRRFIKSSEVKASLVNGAQL